MKNPTKGKNEKELADLLKEKRKALADFSNEVFQGKAKNVKLGRGIRKDIARVLTAIRAKEIENNK